MQQAKVSAALHTILIYFLFSSPAAANGVKQATDKLGDKTSEFATGAGRKGKRAGSALSRGVTSVRKSIENVFK